MQAVKILSGKGHAKQSFFKRFAVLLCFPNCPGRVVLCKGNNKYCFAFLFSKGHAEGVKEKRTQGKILLLLLLLRLLVTPSSPFGCASAPKGYVLEKKKHNRGQGTRASFAMATTSQAPPSSW